MSWASCPPRSGLVQCQPVWSFDKYRGRITLVDVQAVCPEVYLAKRVLQEPAGPGKDCALTTLKAMNE